MNGRIVFSAFLLSVLVIAAILAGGPLESFLNLPSVIITVGAICSGTIWSFPIDKITQSISDAFQGHTPNKERSLQGHSIFLAMADLAIASGLLGTVIGLVQMLQNLDDPSTIGPAMAVALLTLLYGVLLGEFFFRPTATNFLSQHNPFEERPKQRGFSSVYLALISLSMLMLCFFVMLIAFCSFTP